jgi:tetratricopeptide (TPR) repeat protein
LRQRRAGLAEPLLQSVLAERPGNLEAMGLLAGVYALQLREDQARDVLERVDRLDPADATALFEVAEQLGAMRQYPRAEAMYKRAIERAPWWTEPRNALGLLYTQSGDERAARLVLEEARELDPFNLRTTNYLRLLDRLDAMDVVSSEHFEVRFDARTDPFLGELMLEYMESVHKDLSAIFDHSPAVTTLIEVFPTHAQFSVRTTGTPWIGTVGASTGRVIAMVAPRDSADTLGSYNWAQVLRHEYAHTVSLSATENRISHWMTEGLAVYAEQTPLQWAWVPLLYSAVTKDQLFTMDRLTWGFVRPKKPTDRVLAYAQSYWMCRYLIDTYGRESMLQLLGAFKRGLDERAAFTEVIARTPEQFHEEFVRWARREVGRWGYDESSTLRYNQLREQGEALIERRDYPAAVAVWEEIAAIRPMDPLPHQRLAGLYLSAEVNDQAKAKEHLLALHQVETKDNRFAKRLSRLAAEQGDLPEAVRFAREAIWISPYDTAAHQLLLQQAEKAGDTALVETQKRRLSQLERLDRQQRSGEPLRP